MCWRPSLHYHKTSDLDCRVNFASCAYPKKAAWIEQLISQNTTRAQALTQLLPNSLSRSWSGCALLTVEFEVVPRGCVYCGRDNSQAAGSSEDGGDAGGLRAQGQPLQQPPQGHQRLCGNTARCWAAGRQAFCNQTVE